MEIDRSKVSPMMQQYLAEKDNYPDHILFFRLGDFYEMFFEDALTASRVLEITLTGKDCGLEERAPMCGIPYHSAEIYVKKLIESGYRVAIAEQTEDPALAKGIVKRDVIRIVTPGTLVESSMLDEGKNNYIASIYCENKSATVAFADMSTGIVEVFTKSGATFQSGIIGELSRFVPREILHNKNLEKQNQITDFVKTHLPATISVLRSDESFTPTDKSVIFDQIDEEIAILPEFDPSDSVYKVLYSIFEYIAETQKARVKRFTTVNIHTGADFMTLDFNARRNLELTETMLTKDKKGSLLWVLDHTKTAMGRRMLKTFLEQPLTNPTAIIKRQDAIEALYNASVQRAELRENLSDVYDLERLMSRVMYNTANPRDIRALAFTASKLPAIKEQLSSFKAGMLCELNAQISDLSDIKNLIENAIVPEPPVTLKDGGVINKGFNAELDELRELVFGGKGILTEIEEREKQRTGIKTLKVGYNKVFGYYIEVSKSFVEMVPEDYIRKQTLTTGERYITQELKEIENKILNASDKSLKLENEIFNEIKKYISSKLTIVQQTAIAVAKLDVYCSLSEVAVRNNYTRPQITLDGVIEIFDGRHPVIEAIQTDETFVPNDTHLDMKGAKMAIITGPNMAGKSTYMRQVALIVLLAQIGSFVPAKSARIGICDRIFTRVGASDDLSSGRSTFMVEMSEVATILNEATKNSLVILDEIGRGTSTFDGMSIAGAVVEYMVTNKKLGCKTLFATHYHELIELEQKYDCVKNYSIAVAKKGDTIKFLRKIVEGGADDSYGVDVARLAGIPQPVINRANELLIDLERQNKINRSVKEIKAQDSDQVSFEQIAEHKAISKLKKVDPDDYSPREALDLLRELVEML